MYVEYNPNPKHKMIVGDCVIRAISKVMGMSWKETYLELTTQGILMGDLPNANSVWGAYLQEHGFRRYVIPDKCPLDCYSVIDFCNDNPVGTYLLATGTHAVAVIDGDYYDAWDSGQEVPVYYFKR